MLAEMSQLSRPIASPVGIRALYLEGVDFLRYANVTERLYESTAGRARSRFLDQLLNAAVAVVSSAALRLVRVAKDHGADKLGRRLFDEFAVESVCLRRFPCWSKPWIVLSLAPHVEEVVS